MAGSWNHSIEKTSGKLLCNEDAVQMLENGGDWYEYAEEVYGMVWWLAIQLASERADRSGMGFIPAEYVERARQNYEGGIKLSPGIDGRLPDEDD